MTPRPIRRAIDMLVALLEQTDRELAPDDWAGTQLKLGDALISLGRVESDVGRIQDGISAHRAALEE